MLSVSFRSDEFQDIARYAESHGMKVSAFVREAALAKATRVASAAIEGFDGGSFVVKVPFTPKTESSNEVVLHS